MQFYGTGIILHIAVIILNLHDETDTLLQPMTFLVYEN